MSGLFLLHKKNRNINQGRSDIEKDNNNKNFGMNVAVIFPHDPITFSNLFGNMFDIVRRHVVIRDNELKRIMTSFRPGTSADQVESVLQKHNKIFVRNAEGFVQINETLDSLALNNPSLS